MTQIIIRQTADADVREYHTSEELTEVPYSQILDSEMANPSSFSKLGQVSDWLKAMTGVKGLAKVVLRPHSIKFYKTASADWSQVEPVILSAFETTFGSTEVGYFSKTTRQKVLA